MNELNEKELFDDGQNFKKPDYAAQIIQIVKSNASPKIIKDKIQDYHENDIADALIEMNVADRKKLYRILDADVLSDVFEYLDDVGIYLNELDVRKAVEIINLMNADKAVSVLREIDKEKRTFLIDLVDEESKKDIALISSFDEDEIGSKMTTNYIAVNMHLTIKQAMKSLIDQAAENDNISTIYIVDDDETFYGAIDLKDLIVAREGTSLESLITTSYPYVYALETIDDCIEKLKDYSEDSIPVLNNENMILGVITSQYIIQVVDDEMGEDYAMLAGLTAEEDLTEPVRESMRKRLPWLVVLLILGLIVSTVVGMFESVVAELTLIVCFQSLILDMSGNVGTQSLAVTIRVLMDENLTGRQKFELVLKESRVGFVNGLLLGSISFLCIGLYIFFFKQKPLLFSYAISGCIGLALLISMIISSLTGTVIPIFFKKVKVDPAVASGPLITTINDLVAVVTYYGLAWILLINTMHLAG